MSRAMREDGGMTLTEFLLARIALREATALDMREQARRGRPFFDTENLAGGTGIRELIDPARILAECAAQRLMVEDLEEYSRDYREAPSDFAAGRRHAALLAVTRAASAYSDHPDYHDEWRV